MTTRTSLLLVIFSILAVHSLRTHAAERPAANLSIPRWQPHDFVFRGSVKVDNPFREAFSADVKGPGNTTLALPGFYDGEGMWKIRISPTTEGQWSLRTRSTLAALDGQQASFACIANNSSNAHGALLVDRQHPSHFFFEDGTRFFPLGYECDWLWALDARDPTLKGVGAFLDKLQAYGFNYIILNTYAHDTAWRKGNTADDDYGPPPFYAWEGSNEMPDHSRFNLVYWQHYDRIIRALLQRGMIAHILIKVYNKNVKWPAKGSEQEDLYFRWLIARYAAYPNVTWDFSKEAHNEKDLEYKFARLHFLRENDPYRRLLTVHDDHATYDHGNYDAVLDYRCDQQHSDWRATLLEHRRQHRWPVMNVEFGYEHGPNGLEDKTYGVAQSPEEVCRRAWEICTAGGYVAYYYTYTAWDVIRPQDTPPGYAYFKNLRDFFAATDYWLLEPTEGLVSRGYCLANRGHEYVVFLNIVEPFSLNLEGLTDVVNAEWFHPFTGNRMSAGTLTNGTAMLEPPAGWRDEPVALHVGSAKTK